MHVAVVGGGPAGLFTAYYLLREGAEVTIVEARDLGAFGRAAAGALEFTRFKINRITVRDYPIRYLRMMRAGNARVKTWDWGWIWAYLRKWGREPTEDMWEAIRQLGEFSHREYRRLAEEKNDFDYDEVPLYEFTSDVEKELEEARTDPLRPRVEAGELKGRRVLVYLDAAKISTDLAVERLAREVASARIVRRAAQEVRGREVWLEGGDVVKADAVVVAAGYWARRLGVPVAPFKGYGFRTTARPEVMFADMGRGIFVVPLSRWTKVTGRFDLDGTDDNRPAEKVLETARQALGPFEVLDSAVGYRPCTPDGFPVIDRVGSVVVVTGGCRLGWTYGPAMGRLAADLALGKAGIPALSAARFR